MEPKRTPVFLLLALLIIYVCIGAIMVLSKTNILEFPEALITISYVVTGILSAVVIGSLDKKTSIHELLKTSVMIRVLYIFLIIVMVTLVILSCVL